MAFLFLVTLLAQVEWQHPAGIVTDATVQEVRAKVDEHAWARRTYENEQGLVQPWLDVPSEKLRACFPRRSGNVYHNFSCPDDRHRLTFAPFKPDRFTCPSCGAEYDPATDAGIYEPGNRYHGTMYDGWACIFYQRAAYRAGRMGLMGRIEKDARYFDRGVEILMLYADAIEGIETIDNLDPQMRRIFTYHREGESKVLYDAARAYELLRHHMTPEQRERFESVFLERMLNDVMLEPIYTYDHNNLYRWHLTTTTSIGGTSACSTRLSRWSGKTSSTGASATATSRRRSSPTTAASANWRPPTSCPMARTGD
jgi:hypothetical protein